MKTINAQEAALFTDIQARAQAARARQQRVAHFEAQSGVHPILDQVVFAVVASPFVAAIVVMVLQVVARH